MAPSKSQSQHNFMVACCNNAEFAKKNGIDQKVACEFVEADKKAGKWQKKKKATKRVSKEDHPSQHW